MDTKELDRLCEELIQLREDKAAKEIEFENAKSLYNAMERKILTILESLDKSEYSGSFGKIKTTYRKYFQMTDKEAALNWLKERGEYEDLVSVNAQTFSAHCNRIVEEEHAKGNKLFLPPGVTDLTDDRAKLKIEPRR